jgi:PBSX family phage terminase large subunit
VKTSLVHRYEPWGTARQIMSARDPELLVSGPAGTGKSRACLEKVHTMCLINPGMRALIVRKTLSSLGSTALVTFREHVAKESLQVGHVEFYGGSPQEPPQYRYTNGSVIVVGGMDKATKIMSSEYDMIYVQEAIELTENDWEALTTRLRNGKVSFQQLLADANPSTPTHWLKQRCDRGLTRILNSKHEENPTLFTREGTLTDVGRSYISKLDNLTGVRYARLRKGQWVAAEGLIYEDWDPNVHVVDKFDIPEVWPRYWSIDWGYTNPTVIQMWAEDPDGRLFLYREFYMSRRIPADHAVAVLKVVAPGGQWIEPKPTFIVTDHDQNDRIAFERGVGLSSRNAKKDVLNGIQAVQSRIRIAGDGKPRLFLVRGALVERDNNLVDAKRPICTEEELPGYVWDISEGKQPKEKPVKEDDHGCDALRYMVAEKELGPSYRFRSFS